MVRSVSLASGRRIQALAALAVLSSCGGASQNDASSGSLPSTTQVASTTTSSTTAPATTTTTEPPPAPRALIVDDLPVGPPDRMTEPNVAFVQRIIAGIGDEEIASDGRWGQQSQRAFDAVVAALGLPASGELTEQWWLQVFTKTSVTVESLNVAFDPAVVLPSGAVLWRDRSDPTDDLFPREQHFVVAGSMSSGEIADLFLELNPGAQDLGFDEWPSWVVDAATDNDTVAGSYDGIYPGDCFDFPTAQSPSARRVPCSIAHDAQMVHDSVIPQWMRALGRYPTDVEFDDLYFEECVTRADEYRSDWLDDSVNLFMEMVATIQADWSQDAMYSCVWTTYDGGPLTSFVESDTGIDFSTEERPGPVLVASFLIGNTAVGIIDKGVGRTDIAVATLAE